MYVSPPLRNWAISTFIQPTVISEGFDGKKLVQRNVKLQIFKSRQQIFFGFSVRAPSNSMIPLVV